MIELIQQIVKDKLSENNIGDPYNILTEFLGTNTEYYVLLNMTNHGKYNKYYGKYEQYMCIYCENKSVRNFGFYDSVSDVILMSVNYLIIDIREEYRKYLIKEIIND
jgi:hypothetical protein